MRRQQLRFVVLLGAVSIIGILSVQTYFLIKTWNIKEKQLNQSLIISLKSVAEKISKLNQSVVPYGNPVRQITSNYFVVDVNSVIDANVLEYYLKSEFEKHNLKLDYEYAIYDCHTDRMVYGNYISASGNQDKPRLGNNLPKYHEYLYYFGIHFPGLRNTVAADMTVLFFFSAILVISIVFFVYAIFVILQQKRLSELQRDFINNMTHEFKTPISTINISAGVITQSDIVQDPDRLYKYGNFILQENQRMNQLVEKVLQIARIEKGKVKLKMENVDLNSLITAISENYEADNIKGVKMETSLDTELKPVSADILHLTNIFYNLIDNAGKYAGNDPLIRIETKRNPDSVQICFSDNGPGIEPKYQKKIFHKFFRVPSGNIHDVKGFGLGLYYVKIICREHNWKIWVESNAGSGSAFKIEIPYKQ